MYLKGAFQQLGLDSTWKRQNFNLKRKQIHIAVGPGYNTALSCCCSASEWDKVLELLDAMVRCGMDGRLVKASHRACLGRLYSLPL